MKNLFILIFIILFGSIIYAAQEQADIKVEISGIKNIKGQIGFALYDSESSFLKKEQTYCGDFIKVNDKNLNYTFVDIPLGEYALAIFHDVNSNKKLDRNFLGMPTELYAFSNNVYGFMSPPSFKDAKFNLTAKKCALKIKFK